MDFKDAFSSCSHAEMLLRMLQRGVPRQYVRFWHQVASRRTFRVRVGEHLTTAYAAPSGVNQVDCSAPLKWALVVDSLLEELRALPVGGQTLLGHTEEHPAVGEYRCWPVGLADDLFVVVSAGGPDGKAAMRGLITRLQTVAATITRWCSQKGLRLSPKTRVDIFSNNNFVAGTMPNDMPEIEIAGTQVRASVNKEDPPKYLGVSFSHCLGYGVQVNLLGRRLREAASTLRALSLCPIAKRQVAQGLAVSQLRFCAAVWGPFALQHAKSREGLQVAIAQVARGVTGCHLATKGEEVRLEANLPSLHEIVEEACIRAVVRAQKGRLEWTLSVRVGEPNAISLVEALGGIPREIKLEPIGEALMVDLKTPQQALRMPCFVLDGVGKRLRKGQSTVPQLAAASENALGRAIEIAADEQLSTRIFATDGGVADGKSRAVATVWKGEIGAAAAVIPSARGAAELVEVIATADCGALACSFRAEVIAVELLLTYLCTVGPLSCVIVADALSVLTSLACGPARARGRTRRVWRLIRLVTEAGHRLTFVFVYSHVLLAANEAADQRVVEAMREVAATTFPSWGVDVARALKTSKPAKISARRQTASIGTLSAAGPLADSLLAKVPFNMQAFFHQVRSGRLTLVGRRHGGEPRRKCDKCGEVETVDHWLNCVVDPPQRLESFFDVNLLVIRTCFEAWKCRVQQWCENPSRW